MKRKEAASKLLKDMAERLDAAMEALGNRPADIARRLDVPEPSYSRYKSGLGGIPHTVIADLDRLFGISPSYLYTGRESDLQANVKDALEQARRNHKSR